MRREEEQTTKDAQDAIPPPHGRKLRQNTFSEVQLEQAEKLTNNSGIPQHEIENIARILLPDILAFYESEEGQREFAEWKAARDGAKTDKDSNGENVA